MAADGGSTGSGQQVGEEHGEGEQPAHHQAVGRRLRANPRELHPVRHSGK